MGAAAGLLLLLLGGGAEVVHREGHGGLLVIGGGRGEALADDVAGAAPLWRAGGFEAKEGDGELVHDGGDASLVGEGDDAVWGVGVEQDAALLGDVADVPQPGCTACMAGIGRRRKRGGERTEAMVEGM